MNSGARDFHVDDCCSTSNISQTGSQFLECVKIDPTCSNPFHVLSLLNTSKMKNKKARKRKADTFLDNGPKKRKSANDIKPPKLELDDSDGAGSPDNAQTTNDVGHICGVISDNLIFKRKTEEIQGTDYVIPDLTNVDLPLCYMKSVFENKIISCNVKNYAWEKLVNHEFVSKIDNNMKRTVDLILLPEDERECIRNEVIADFYDVFSEDEWKNRWHCFDSYLQGIVHQSACIDVCYEAPPFKNVREMLQLQQELCTKLETASCFQKPIKTKGMLELGKPCIRISHKKTKKQINISFSSLIKVECSRVMKFYLDMNSNLKYLTVYLELIFKKYRIKKKRASILPPYSTFWLAVFFMQQKNLLPAVIDVRRAAQIKHHVTGWDCSLPEDYSCPPISVSLYSLLLGFFDFYKDFDFLNYVICPYLGHVISLSDIENLELCTDEWSTYLRQIQNRDQVPFIRSFLNLQDPTDLGRNLDDDVFRCVDLNIFIAVCHRLSDTLPKHMDEFDKINCVCQILLDSIDQANYHSSSFAKYEMFEIHRKNLNEDCREKLNQSYLLEAFRKLMEFIFKLEPTSVTVSQNFNRVKFNRKTGRVVTRSFPIMHLEYCSSENTWQSDYMNEIIPEKGPVRIYLRCEVDLIMQHKVHIYAQGEARFMGFLRSNLRNMLASVLNQIISP